MSRFKVTPTPLTGLLLVQRTRIEDERGFFSRFYCAEEMAPHIGLATRWVQINHTLTRRCGTVRGMHFQHPPHAEAKFVSCLRGEIFDVAVDVRKGSATFLRWHGAVLSAANSYSLLIPEGFAHGFQTLTDNCELIYLHSRPYAAEAEGALSALDPALSIAWPLPVCELSGRDASHPPLSPDFTGIPT